MSAKSARKPLERDIQTEIMLELGGRPDVRLFRNNVGQGWAGEFLGRDGNGSVILGHARPLHAGLIVGSGDLLGWITQNGIARFLSIEVKQPGKKPSPAQIIWRNNVVRAGGIAYAAVSVEEAIQFLR